LAVAPLGRAEASRAYGLDPDEGGRARYSYSHHEYDLSRVLVRPPRPAPRIGPPPGPEAFRDWQPHPALAADVRDEVRRHAGHPLAAEHLLRRLDEIPDAFRWLCDRHAAGDRLDVGKLHLLSEFMAGAALDPALLRLLGPATSHWGLARVLDRHRQDLAALKPGHPERYDDGDEP
jgi:hypothetical protein